MDLGLKDKVVLVTGGASGIGKTICEHFKNEQAIVISLDVSYTENKVEQAYGEFAGAVDDDAVYSKLLDFISTNYKRLDVLVNNAGISRPGSVTDLQRADWSKVLDVHMTGPFMLIKTLLPLLQESEGSIVNTTSFASKRSTLFGNNISYTASKHGLLGITREMAVELAPCKIRVNAVAPGPVATEMIKLHSPEKRAKIETLIPFGRMAEPSEIADTVLFLSSKRASYISGECVSVNAALYID